MILPKPEDAKHKAWLYRLLSSVYDSQLLANTLYFKGGTAAAMLGWLDRFSVDLDFDCVAAQRELSAVRRTLEKIFTQLNLEIKDGSRQVSQYWLRYPAGAGERQTIKLDITMPPPRSNDYQAYHLPDLQRVVTCQTRETWLGNKMVALVDRYQQREVIAGRDVYDLHHFFFQGARYNQAIISERTGLTIPVFLQQIVEFIRTKVSQRVIDQELNMLLPAERFQRLRRSLVPETLRLLNDELARLTQ